MAPSIQVQLGNRVRALRKEQSLTQEDLAERSGLHVTYLSGIENGSRNPSLTAIAALAKGFGKTVAELLEGIADA
ncbi:MAG: helix-turn-helix transcriptional regulator [Fimbriimonadaceae bacterium]